MIIDKVNRPNLLFKEELDKALGGNETKALRPGRESKEGVKTIN